MYTAAGLLEPGKGPFFRPLPPFQILINEFELHIPTRGADYVHQITNCPPRIFKPFDGFATESLGSFNN